MNLSPEHLSYAGWLLLGVSAGLGPCFSHSLLIVLPYIGMSREGTVKALREVLSFSLGRIISHTLLGAVAGLTGLALYQIVSSPTFSSAAGAAFGGLLMLLAVAVLFAGDSSACSLLHERLISDSGRAMLLAGGLTAVTPCPFLLALLSSAAASGSGTYGMFSALSFAVGSVVSPILFFGPLFGFLKNRMSSRWLVRGSRVFGAIFLFGYGAYTLVKALS